MSGLTTAGSKQNSQLDRVGYLGALLPSPRAAAPLALAWLTDAANDHRLEVEISIVSLALLLRRQATLRVLGALQANDFVLN